MADPLDVWAGVQWPSHSSFGVGVCLGEGRWIHSEGGPSQGRLVKLEVSRTLKHFSKSPNRRY